MLLPLGDQGGVGDAILDAVVVQLAGDGLALVEEVEDVPRSLVVDLEDRPECLRSALALVRLGLRLAHLRVQLLDGRLDQVPALRRLAGSVADGSHFGHRLNLLLELSKAGNSTASADSLLLSVFPFETALAQLTPRAA